MNSEHPGALTVVPYLSVITHHLMLFFPWWQWHGPGSICCDWGNHGRKHLVPEKWGWLRPQRRWGLHSHLAPYYIIRISSDASVKVCKVTWFVFLHPVWVFLVWREHSDMRLWEGILILPYTYSFWNRTVAQEKFTLYGRMQSNLMLILWPTAKGHWKPSFLLAWLWASPKGPRGCKSPSCRDVRLNDGGNIRMVRHGTGAVNWSHTG